MPILKVQTDAKLVAKNMENLKAEVPKIGRFRIYDTLKRAEKRLKKPGKKRTYPIPWVSIRQRSAFFASGGFGGGIPHVRRGVYQKSFVIKKLPQGYELMNKMKGAKHVGGDARGRYQSRIHKGFYPLIRDEVDREVRKLPKAVVAHLKVVARQKGFAT